MDTFSLVVGFSLAIGVGMIANTVISILFETGRRLAVRYSVDVYTLSDSEPNIKATRKEQKKQFWGSATFHGKLFIRVQP